MPLLFARHSRHIDFIGVTVNIRRIMFERVFDPSSIVAIRLLIVLIQVGAAVLILTTIIAIRRRLVIPVVFGRRRHD